MNYRHAYHAGNHADVVKHIVITRILAHLRKKEKAFHCVDAHAGIGTYALNGMEALKTGEWQGGIAKMQEPFAPPVEELLADYRSVIAKLNKTTEFLSYPGSPEFMAQLSRSQDRLTFNELHPQDFLTLRDRYNSDPRVTVFERDATVVMKATLPPPERRGLVLIDPPFELRNERELALQSLTYGHRRFANGIFLVWYPVKGLSFAEDFCAAFQTLGIGPMLKIELRVREAFDAGGLAGSGLLLINPPWGLKEELELIIPSLAQRLGLGSWGKGQVEWLIQPKNTISTTG